MRLSTYVPKRVLFIFPGHGGYYQRDWRNRKYSVSKRHEPFNLAQMNDRCKQIGGYLVQIDDKHESFQVAQIAKWSGGFGPYFTGITDEGSEGHFYNYNDKTPAKYLRWRWFQPDNWRGENCVEMYGFGLNDKRCGKRGRYICESPI
ncbi:pulmonary surfactant-associated protein a [Plakobranchus ocellatus]|uniref:Pulmonary surfactant-associated protein a n=1 Tax=Plakobranchus ocellatus TaxID=259542 RepID=A0AAV4DIT6_9GAST|nr:pulmonary surfactant-associated protein a [Plakobranchus ocellatus]